MSGVQRHLPSGTVSLLFTDIEGSTKLLHELGEEAYADALAAHRRVLREAFEAHEGVEVDTQGDAFFVAFPTASGALRAAAEAQEALASGLIRVRMGLHTATPHLSAEGYVGADVHKGARIAAAGHGGQVLLSAETREEVLDELPLTDLGEHRVKDFAEPVGIFQLGQERFPPLRTISNTNLPRLASSFVGREREVSEVAALLKNGARLLTLTGPGGTGKTRLAIEAAAELVPEFKAGVFFVGLAPLRDPALVTETIAQTLGAKDGLTDHIGERELLLLLDNLEQVVAAAPDLASLVEACPNLRLLSTSRELLRVRGEVEYPVLPLADREAVELFCARAGTEADESVRELCRALDNLPLALELAAARASVLSPTQILKRLSQRLDLLKDGRDADPRQQTLRATIEWSYDLLSREEQRLFARLSVFSGGCTLETAEEVAEVDLDTLQSLVDKSLVRRVDERFSMLETIREYAAERLEGSGEANELRRRHAEHFLALAEEAEPDLLRGASAKQWPERLEREHDNLRAALDHFEVSGETELALRLSGALSEFWVARGHLVEGRRRLESALAADDRPTLVRAKALNGASGLAANTGDIAAATVRAEEALGLARALGDAWTIANALWSLGYLAVEEGEVDRALPLVEESVRIFGELGEEANAIGATRTLAFTYERSGDTKRAVALHEDNLRRARALRDGEVEALTLAVLATMYVLYEGRVKDALPMLGEAYRIHRDLGERLAIMGDLYRFAGALAVAGKAGKAARLLSSAEVLREEFGSDVPWIREMNEGTLATVRAQLDEAAFSEASEQGRKLTPDEAVALALALD
jgi:predicted ATPase/class 3 adenylate cyclase